MALSNILPDPTHAINTAGQSDVAGTAGVGYAGVKLNSVEPVMKHYSNARRQEKDLASSHRWEVNITYNDLTCEQFHLIYAFVNYRQCRMEPFYVSVPPYSDQVLPGITLNQLEDEKTSVALVDGTGVLPGMLFSVAGTPKTYQVTRVETETVYEGTAPAAGQERLHFTPGFLVDVAGASAFTFTDPMIKVMLNTTSSNYSITKDGLFKLALNLKEVII
jgi:hypothetical protein